MSSRLILAAAPLLAGALLAGTDSFCIGGQVVNGSTGEPLPRSAVTIPQSAALTDASGSFHFCGLAPGAYYANAERPGFASSGTLVPVGPSREDVTLRLLPLGVIHGMVVDGDNHPMENALVQVLSTTTEGGRRKVRVEGTVSADDRGEYRLPNLKPGRYYLRAAGWQGPENTAGTKDNEPHQTFAPTYYSGSSDISAATMLTVEAGGNLTADFTVRLEPAYAVRGSISGYSSLIEMNAELVRPDEGLSTAPVTFNPLTGAFQANHVAPGNYILRATQGDGDQRTHGEQAVEVNASDVNDLVVSMGIPMTVTGVVHTAASSGTKPAAANCSIELSSVGMLVNGETLQASTGDGGAAALLASVLTPGEGQAAAPPPDNQESNGDFEIQGVLPGRYRIRMDCAGGYVASARAGDTDLLAHNELVIGGGLLSPIDVVVNTDGATVDVVTAKDDEGTSAWLVLLPDAGSELHTKFTVLKGKTTFSGVAPGDYHAYAWTGSPYAFEYADPSARQMWANRAVSVHVAEHDHVTVTAKIASGDVQ